MEFLMETDGWVLFHFPDGTIETMHTSLSDKVLRKYGAVVKDGFLYDLDRCRYQRWRQDVKDVTFSRDKPEFDSEVLKFANRFI